MLRKPKTILGTTRCDYKQNFSASILKYIAEADNCDAVKDEFVSVDFNVNTGVLTVSTDPTKLPNMNTPVRYYLYVDGAEQEDLGIVGGTLDFSMQLNPIDGNGEIPSHTVMLIVASTDNSKGCKFEFTTSPILSSDYVLLQEDTTYSITLRANLNQYTTMDLSEFDIIWGIRNGSVLVGETEPSMSISTASLYRITGSSTVVLYTKFGDIVLYSEELALPQHGIGATISLSNVLNDTTFYTNIVTEVEAGDNTIYTYLYLDNQLITETHIPTIGNIGKKVTIVITTEENSVGSTFNELATSTYFLHKSATVTDEYNLDMTFPMNAVLDRSMVSSQNSNRSLDIVEFIPDTAFNTIKDYIQPVSLANTYDSSYVIQAVSNEVGLSENNIREGLIIDDEYYDSVNQVAVTGLRVYDSNLELQPVTRGYLVNKKVEEENKLNTLIFSSVEDFTELGFVGDISSYYNISDKYIGFNSDTSSIISKDFNSNQILNGLQFELEYGNIASSIPVFIVVKVYKTDSALHSTYGYEKVEDGKMKLTDAKANISISSITSGSEYISKSFANIYDIGRIDIQVSGGQSSQLAIRNLYIDVVEGD